MRLFINHVYNPGDAEKLFHNLLTMNFRYKAQFLCIIGMLCVGFRFRSVLPFAYSVL